SCLPSYTMHTCPSAQDTSKPTPGPSVPPSSPPPGPPASLEPTSPATSSSAEPPEPTPEPPGARTPISSAESQVVQARTTMLGMVYFCFNRNNSVVRSTTGARLWCQEVRSARNKQTRTRESGCPERDRGHGTDLYAALPLRTR